MNKLTNHYNMSALINFKEIYTVRSLQMLVYLQISVTEFINETSGLLASHFGINEDELEIVLSGQYSEELPSEAMPALTPSDATLRELWGDRLHNLSFYIRRKNQVYPHVTSRIVAPIVLQGSVGYTGRPGITATIGIPGSVGYTGRPGITAPIGDHIVTAPIGDQVGNPLHTQMHTNICVDDCPICLEHGELVRRYDCTHGICTTCYVACINSNIIRCSLCRAL